MIRNKQYFTEDGIQISVYFMEVMGISQGVLEGYSHKMRYAIDDAGKDAGICSAYAPFDLKIKWIKPTGSRTGVVFVNTRPVLLPDYKVYPAGMVVGEFWHDNNTKDLKVGQEIKQGVEFYQEGTADNASGNHIHIMASVTGFEGPYPLYRTKAGNWALKGQVHPVGVFFVNDTVRRRDKGYAWKVYEGNISTNDVEDDDEPIVVSNKTYTVVKGDTLSKIAAKYRITWQKLYQANKSTIGTNPSAIKIGMKLLIP